MDKSLESRIKERWGKLTANAPNAAQNSALDKLHKAFIENCAADVAMVMRESLLEYSSRHAVLKSVFHSDDMAHAHIQNSPHFSFGESLYDLRRTEAETGARNMLDIRKYYPAVKIDDPSLYTERKIRGFENCANDMKIFRATTQPLKAETPEQWVSRSTHEVLAVLLHGTRDGGNISLLKHIRQLFDYAQQAPDKTGILEQSIISRTEKFLQSIPLIQDKGRFIAKINARAKSKAAHKSPNSNGNNIEPLF